MEARHLLLGKPWKFDRQVKNDGVTNKYMFVCMQRTITLVPIKTSVWRSSEVAKRGRSEERKREKRKWAKIIERIKEREKSRELRENPREQIGKNERKLDST